MMIKKIGYVQEGCEKLIQNILKGKQRIQANYDFHGMNLNECSEYLKDIIDICWENNTRVVLLIHGKGTNKLRNFIHDYCHGHPLLLACIKAPNNLGGDGATVIVFKRRKNFD